MHFHTRCGRFIIYAIRDIVGPVLISEYPRLTPRRENAR